MRVRGDYLETIEKTAVQEAWIRLISEVKLKQWRGPRLSDRSPAKIAECIETWFRLKKIACARNHTFIEVSMDGKAYTLEVTDRPTASIKQSIVNAGATYVFISTLPKFFKWYDEITL